MIGVIGNAVVDLSYEVQALPRPGETILASASKLDIGGKGLNQAIASHRAGSKVRFAAVIGNDAHGKLIEQQIQSDGMQIADLIYRDGPSDHSIIYVGIGGENCIVSTIGMAASLSIEKVNPLIEALGNEDTLLLQGNLSMPLTRACLEHAHARHIRTLVNPAPITFDYGDLWRLIDVVIVNQVEGEMLTDEIEQQAIIARLRAFGPGLAVITLGKAGALLGHDDQSLWVDAPTVQTVDSTGAGDIFCGVFAAALDQGMTSEDACRWAVLGASQSVTRNGTINSFPSSKTLQALRPSCPGR